MALRSNTVTLDSFMVPCEYTHPNRGQHRVYGFALFTEPIGPNMIKDGDKFRFSYGYRGQGDRFLVHRADIEMAPHLFRARVPPAPAVADVAQVEPPPPTFDPQAIPGVTKAFAAVFAEREYDSPDCILELGFDGLMLIEGMTDRRANTILKGAAKLKEKVAA
jgi:hypothetical protein